MKACFQEEYSAVIGRIPATRGDKSLCFALMSDSCLSNELGDTLDNIANVGLATVAGVVTAAAGALVAAAESTREYRTEMAKLDTAFTDNGHTSEAALGAYRELQGVLGDTDQAVEAANHLAVLTDNEKDLATWTGDILPGIFATFGASLPIEGLTEAA